MRREAKGETGERGNGDADITSEAGGGRRRKTGNRRTSGSRRDLVPAWTRRLIYIENILYYGNALTGKTTKLIAHYRDLTEKGLKTDSILVLVQDGREITRWREHLLKALPIAGSLQVFSYWGFVQSEVARHWNWAEKELYGSLASVRPSFITAEIAHFLITIMVNDHRMKGKMNTVATPEQMAIQILNNMNLAATFGMKLDEAFLRVQSVETDPARRIVIGEALAVARGFRKTCVESRSFDYSMAVEIFNTILLRDSRYREMLSKRFKVLIADNLEEGVPSQTDLVELMLQSCRSFAVFDPDGGHTDFFGADPDYAWDKLHSLYKIERCLLNPNTILADTVASNIKNGLTLETCSVEKPLIKLIDMDYRSELILSLAEHIEKLNSQGCSLDEIAIIAPVIDRVLEVSLKTLLKSKHIQVQLLNRREYLADKEFAQVMVVLVSLIEKSPLAVSELAQAFKIILGLDPVRSNLLAKFSNSKGLEAALPADLIGRIGFAANNRYREFCDWIIAKRNLSADASIFQQLFGEVMAGLVREEGDLSASRQLIQSAVSFEKSQGKIDLLKGMSFVEGFANMIRQGTIAAEAGKIQGAENNGVVLATPLAIFKSSRSFKYQFWVDGSSESWTPRRAREINNYHLMSKGWNGRWDDSMDIVKKAEGAAKTVSGLILRCTGEIVLLVSEYNSMGQEQEGDLPDIIRGSVGQV